jgi:hypothetical protein
LFVVLLVIAPPSQELEPTGDSHGFRNIVGIDRHRLRLFFLSLLWRSGASKRKEVAEIDVPSDDLEKLRLMLLNKNAGSLSFYPTVLVQLSTCQRRSKNASAGRSKRVHHG